MSRATEWAWTGLIVLWALACPAAEPADGPEAAGGDQIELTLRVQGDLFATAAAGADPVRRPISLEARFEFVERPLTDAGGDGVTRRYSIARADIETDGHRAEQRLARDARDVLFRLEGTTPRPYLAEGFLARDEAELLDVPFDPLLIDSLQPDHPVAAGASWKLPADLAAGLLAIDTVESGGITASLAEVGDGRATMTLEGTVVGAADGVPTRIQVTGRATAQAASDDDQTWRIEGPITTLEATIAERREAGWIAPGLDLEATVTIKRSPAATPTESLAAGTSEPTPAADELAAPEADRPAGKGRPGVVWHRHHRGRYASVLDARWRVVEDGPEGLVLRLSDRGRLVAQCSILPLPRVASEAAPSEETVRGDVRRSLGEQFGLLAESESATRDDGTRVVRVVAEGAADGRAFRWIHYVLTDPAGHRVAVTFMHEPALIDRFAAADRELVAGLVVRPDAAPRQAVARPAPPAQPR
jgi:hypothetical protein